ncbi:hypothetical protein AB0C14_28170 [Microbispora hainanensis]
MRQVARLTVVDRLPVGVAARRTYGETLTALEDTVRAVSGRRRT